MAITPRIRALVLARDHFRCRWCGATGDEIKLEVDHILPRSEGGTDSLENLATLCRQCNVGKSDLYFGDYTKLGLHQLDRAERARAMKRIPLPYQLDALNQILEQVRSLWGGEFTLQELARTLPLQDRDGVHPPFEPLTLRAVEEAFRSLLRDGKIVKLDHSRFRVGDGLPPVPLSEVEGSVDVEARDSDTVEGAVIHQPTRLKAGSQISVKASGAKRVTGLRIGGEGGS